MKSIPRLQPGPLALLGSGETSASGRRAFEWLFRRLEPPVRVAILETPAGFQPNSRQVAQDVADFLEAHLPAYRPAVTIVPARKRGTPFSPDDTALIDDVLAADCIFLGPGSPTYAARQLRGSALWDAVRAGYATGAALILASAAVLAVGAHTLPVYEIYKAGFDLEWYPGLDLLGTAGASVTFVPHWNNREGGAGLDTSHCFVGPERFATLRAMLPSDVPVVGIDEHTALIVDPEGLGWVLGAGEVTIERAGEARSHASGESFPLAEIEHFDWNALVGSVSEDLLRRAARLRLDAPPEDRPEPVPTEVHHLVERREAARKAREWRLADALRAEIAQRGYQVQDTPDGPRVSVTSPG
ncbi:MAG TPA: cysteinyl-tRNA synthetase [Chloroflexota bacterium]|nr:cysteinyl-tRNA synthetase [Chloroflexota bacterium]